jgi:TP901 family phage tail tape measure protein
MAAERKITTRIEMKGDAEYRRKMSQINKEMGTFSGWAGTMAGQLAAKAITKGLELIASGFKNAFDASVEFESALIGVAKTTDMSDVQLAAFGKQMQELSTQIPVSTTELLGLAEAAGQLGVADKDIEQFVKIVAAMGVSTNMSADEAAVALAQIGNVMGTTVYEYERMGSSIVALGNNSATTESAIVELSQRLAGAANLVGISEADMLAYAAAMSSVGIEAEAGGSALSKVWRELETMVALGSDDLAGFAQVAGMSADRFAEAWKEDASGAFMQFMAGLGDAEANGQSAIAVLSELGIVESRTVDTLTRMVGANDLLTRSLDISNTAWDENVALSEEANKFYGTTASQIKMAEDALTNLGVAAGDGFKTLVLDYANTGKALAQSLQDSVAGQKSLPDMISEADAAYQMQAASIESVAGQALALVDRLDELGNVTQLTGKDQQEYLATLGLLKDIMPSAAGIIDLQTGAIEGGTAALRENVAAAKENALQTAQLDAEKERYDSLTIAQQNLADKRALYTVAISDSAKAQADYNAILAEMADMEAAAQEEADNLNAQMGQNNYVGTDILQANEDYYQLTLQLESAANAMYEAQNNADDLGTQIAAESAQLEDAEIYADQYAEGLAGMSAAYESAAESGGAVSESMQQQINDFQAMDDRISELNAELVATMDLTREQVNSIISGFGAIEMPEAISTTDVISNLQSQLDYMKTYTDNLAKVQEMGLDQTLVEQLSDGSEESAAILQGIVDDGGANIDELNAKFAEVSTGKDAMALAMAEAQTDFQTKTDLIVDATNKMVENFNQEMAANSAGADTIQGLIDGINSKLSVLRTKSNLVRSLMNFGGGGGGSGGGSGPGGPVRGTHASGLSYVPADGYIAELHRGEMVLTALEARAYRAEQYANYGMLAALAHAGDTNIVNDNRKTYTSNVSTGRVQGEQTDARLELMIDGRVLAEVQTENNIRVSNMRARRMAIGVGKR